MWIIDKAAALHWVEARFPTARAPLGSCGYLSTMIKSQPMPDELVSPA